MNESTDGIAWYRLPVMWLVIALPLLSMVGGGVLVAVTIAWPDPEVYSERLDAPPVDTP